MDDRLKGLCDQIISEADVKKIILYGKKAHPISGELREVNLCILVDKDPKESEIRLYRRLESELSFNLLVYDEKEFASLCRDVTSYAHSIAEKGTVLHG